MNWIIVGLLILAGVTKAFLDTSSINGFNGKWWNKGTGWKFKWKKGRVGDERFPFSSTALVFLTDFWHLSQFIMLRFLYLAIALPLYDESERYAILWLFLNVFVVFPVALGFPFQIVYSKLNRKNGKK